MTKSDIVFSDMSYRESFNLCHLFRETASIMFKRKEISIQEKFIQYKYGFKHIYSDRRYLKIDTASWTARE